MAACAKLSADQNDIPVPDDSCIQKFLSGQAGDAFSPSQGTVGPALSATVPPSSSAPPVQSAVPGASYPPNGEAVKKPKKPKKKHHPPPPPPPTHHSKNSEHDACARLDVLVVVWCMAELCDAIMHAHPSILHLSRNNERRGRGGPLSLQHCSRAGRDQCRPQSPPSTPTGLERCSCGVCCILCGQVPGRRPQRQWQLW